ncbi:MAG TPA: DUF3413 domain-containing protein [Bacteriovoracaceae bacterium]|nr:DUF3413 domain-containing protein [Bacteriovoracaceae bacterium]
MNRKNFILSWGRKLFFSISWPVSVLLGLIYLRGYVAPKSALEFLYLITTLIGHFGLLNALVYFFLFYPVVSLFPSYYMARFWSLLLIIALNLAVFIDASIFSSYGIHFNKLIFELYSEEGIRDGMTLKLIAGAFVIAGIMLWLRGEKIWRYMQTRFSNPISNWYIVVMVLLVGAGQFIYHSHQTEGVRKFSHLFPLIHDLPLKQKSAEKKNQKSLLYPSSYTCSGTNNQNVIMIVFKEWEHSQLSKELMPHTYHIANHGMRYSSHHSAASGFEEGLFTLMYSIPANYRKTAEANKTSPAFISELQKRNYQIVSTEANYPVSVGPKERDAAALSRWKAWTINQSQTKEARPFFGFIKLEQHALEADSVVQEIINDLKEQNLLQEARIIITGAYGGKISGSKNIHPEELKVPFVMITPERTHGEIKHFTSHYDVLPSVMEKMWNCKNTHALASFGKPLEEELKKDWFLLSSEDNLGILDFKSKFLTTIASKNEILDLPMAGASGKPRHELILEALKEINKLYKLK